ncbi:ribosome biogenesis protein [Candidatus Woesearchaeota archaeon]|nr:ribosome biogenesis protein [Candidatus Woesearchaeota archaeon]
MTEEILQCEICKKYTLEKFCECSGKCLSPKPAKFSPEDKYGYYRLSYKKKSQNL